MLNKNNLSIGIVTYLGRFEEYFKPLIKNITRIFPDYEINIFINGHYDQSKQIQYLKEVTSFLHNYKNVRYITNFEHQSLAKGWNWLVILSSRTYVLIMNDDIMVKPKFRIYLENIKYFDYLKTFNQSWSHFIINKKCIEEIGWFDERFLGVGDEDGDYMCRLGLAGLITETIYVSGLTNYVVQMKDAGWSNFSSITHGKYSKINKEIFNKKWSHSDYEKVDDKNSFKVIHGTHEWYVKQKSLFEKMPVFYTNLSLENHNTTPLKSYIVEVIYIRLIALIDFYYFTALIKIKKLVKSTKLYK